MPNWISHFRKWLNFLVFSRNAWLRSLPVTYTELFNVWQASQWHETYCHDLEVMSSSPCSGQTWGASYFCLSCTWTKNFLSNAESPNLAVGGKVTTKYMHKIRSAKRCWKKNENFFHGKTVQQWVPMTGLTLKVLLTTIDALEHF